MRKTPADEAGPRWTPGPWHVFKGGNFVSVVAEGYEEFLREHHNLGGPLCVAELNYNATPDYDKDPGRALANAHLIAAAPDLLRELRLFVIACSCGLHQDGIQFNGKCGPHGGCTHCAAALTAIAKAEGRDT